VPDENETTRLRAAQARREQAERELADEASEPSEREMHKRRSDKAAYLRQKLEEQEQAPDE